MSIISKAGKIFRYLSSPGLYKYGFASLFRIGNIFNSPIIVCGAPRSGTTLLVSILDSHDAIVSIPYETRILMKIGRSSWKGWNRWFLRLQLKALLISIGIKRSSKHWCEKTPSNIFYLEQIFAMFGQQTRVINIVRDGRDVVLSVHGRLGKLVTPSIWTRFVRQGLLYRGDPRVLTLKYEDLILQFDETMKLVSSFLGLPNTFKSSFFENTSVSENRSVMNGHGWKGVYTARPIFTDSIMKWRSHPEVVEEFRKQVEASELLAAYDYIAPGEGNSNRLK
jgi:hypothetical protein